MTNAQTGSTRPEAVVPKVETPNQTLNPTQKLEALDAMVKRGLITQDEYNAKKLAILSSL